MTIRVQSDSRTQGLALPDIGMSPALPNQKTSAKAAAPDLRARDLREDPPVGHSPARLARSAAPAAVVRSESLSVPAVTIPKEFAAAREQFAAWTKGAADRVRAETGGPQVAVAPFGGSRITALQELDLDGLVLVDWGKPGSPDDIRRAFKDTDGALSRSLNAAVTSPGMNSSDVMASPMAAEILGRLRVELGVTDVTVSYYLPQGVSPTPGNPPAIFSGDHVSPADPPLVTRFQFEWRGRTREVVLCSYAISADTDPTRPSLPSGTLASLRPQGYAWTYISADGMAIFSADPDNGLQKTSRALLDLTQAKGGVLVDYPRSPAYWQGGQDSEGMKFMRGRADLEALGLDRLSRYPMPEDPNRPGVFGYCGLSPDDEVRAYQKPSGPVQKPAATPAALSFGDLRRVGRPTTYHLSR